jgi:Ca2+-binding EF-hand superfamily protein
MAEDTPLSPAEVDVFASSMEAFINGGSDSNVDECFSVLDRNGDGTVSRLELETVMIAVAAREGDTITQE